MVQRQLILDTAYSLRSSLSWAHELCVLGKSFKQLHYHCLLIGTLRWFLVKTPLTRDFKPNLAQGEGKLRNMHAICCSIAYLQTFAQRSKSVEAYREGFVC